MRADAKTVQEVLIGSNQYLVPFFQRYYSWKRKHWEKLWEDITYLRMAFCGELGEHDPARPLDSGIVRTVWLTPDEVRASADRHRSPLVLRCIEDYLAGIRHPLSAIYTDPSVPMLQAHPAR